MRAPCRCQPTRRRMRPMHRQRELVGQGDRAGILGFQLRGSGMWVSKLLSGCAVRTGSVTTLGLGPPFGRLQSARDAGTRPQLETGPFLDIVVSTAAPAWTAICPPAPTQQPEPRSAVGCLRM